MYSYFTVIVIMCTIWVSLSFCAGMTHGRSKTKVHHILLKAIFANKISIFVDCTCFKVNPDDKPLCWCFSGLTMPLPRAASPLAPSKTPSPSPGDDNEPVNVTITVKATGS